MQHHKKDEKYFPEFPDVSEIEHLYISREITVKVVRVPVFVVVIVEINHLEEEKLKYPLEKVDEESKIRI